MEVRDDPPYVTEQMPGSPGLHSVKKLEMNSNI